LRFKNSFIVEKKCTTKKRIHMEISSSDGTLSLIAGISADHPILKGPAAEECQLTIDGSLGAANQ